ncbi:MAG: TIGR00730 family Rossman fold protein [Acidobacteriota bacterium]|nr:TIGR00730 family Rossman fold protein [Acidobacteriota bacterium]MDH3529195.1 TIGR00730 family Rossman fold protein [Acidobacteriota bacterium]
MSRLNTVCVFCGSNPGTEPEFLEAATETGKFLAENRIGLVFGGGRVGLMGRVADTVMAAGGKVIGVIPRDLAEKEVAHQNLTELHVVESMHKRKALMAKLSDGFVAMPGGFGTFEEICEVITWTQLGFQQKPCGILNTNGYYKNLIALFDNATEKGFIRSEHRRLVLVSDKIDDLIDQLTDFEPTRLEKWIDKDSI